MTNARTRWMTMASLLVVVAGLDVACSSSDNGGGAGGSTADSGSGTGGKTTGTGGAAGGAAVVHLLPYTFDSSDQSWILNSFADSSSRNLSATYAADGGSPDAQVFSDGGAVAKPTIAFDNTTGSPSPGSLKVTATFTDCNQYVDAVVNLAAPLDLTGKTVHGQLAVTSGVFSGGAQLHVSTTNYTAYLKSPFVLSTTVGAYGSAALDLTTAVADVGTKDTTMVNQVGVQIFSGGAPTCTAAMPYANVGQVVTFNLDTITD